MTTPTESPPAEPIRLEGQALTEWQEFFLSRGPDLLKQAIPTLNDVLQKMIVLNTALVGVFLGLKDVPVPMWARLAAVLCFVLSLSLAFFGVYPREWRVRLDCPEDIRDSELMAIKRKGWFLKSAAVCLVAGFAVGLVGLLVGASVPVSPPAEKKDSPVQTSPAPIAPGEKK